MRYIVLAAAFMLATPAMAQPAPDRPISITITFAEYSKLWEILGEVKAKEVFGIMVKINNQAIQQLSAPQAEPNKEKAQ